MTDALEWHARVRQLLDLGKTADEIAETVGKSRRTLARLFKSWGLALSGGAGKRGRRSRYGDEPAAPPRQSRRPRAIIDRSAVSGATRAFAAGEIDRAEMMRRISPENRA